MNRLTIIGHLKNEEYLLPWWLSHHLALADHIVLVDYRSTDDSLRILNRHKNSKIRVLTTRNVIWDAAQTDQEIMDLESEIQGWKIALQITDFLTYSRLQLEALFSTESISAWRIPAKSAIDLEPWTEPKHSLPLVTQKPWGIDEDTFTAVFGKDSTKPLERRTFFRKLFDSVAPFLSVRKAAQSLVNPRPRNRLLHKLARGNYKPGRHEWNVVSHESPLGPGILHYAISPWNENLVRRRLVTRNSIPFVEIMKGRGWLHFLPIRQQEKALRYWIELNKSTNV